MKPRGGGVTLDVKLRIDVNREPRTLTWDPAVLRSFVGKLALVPEGVSASDYLQRNREAAGFAD